MVKRSTVSVCVVALCMASTGIASAETESADEARARELFDEGIRLANDERWTEAVAAFRYSAELVPRASTSYNIASGLHRLEHQVQALAELDRYDRMDEVIRDPKAQARGKALRKLIEKATASIRIRVTPTDAHVFLDGHAKTTLGPGEFIRVDPGTHSLQVRRIGYEPYIGTLEFESGTQATVKVELDPRSVAATATPADVSASLARTDPAALDLSSDPPSAKDRKPFVKRPGFWVLVGVVAAAGIAAGVAVAVTRKDAAPQCGTTGACATTSGLTVSWF